MGKEIVYAPKGGAPQEVGAQVVRPVGWRWRFRFLDSVNAPMRFAVVGAISVGLLFGLAYLEPTQVLLIGAVGVFAAFGALYFGARVVVNVVISAAAEIIFDYFGEDDANAAYELLYDYLIKHEAPVVVFRNGKPTDTSLKSPLFKMGLRGPGFLRVDAQTAVLLQQGNGRTFQVKLKGDHFFKKGEQVRWYADIGVQKKLFELENVYTKDNLPLKLKGTLYFRLLNTKDVLARATTALPVSQVLRLASSIPNWQEATVITAEAKIRDVFAEFDLNAIHGTYPQVIKFKVIGDDAAPAPPTTNRVTIQQRLDAALNAALMRWGAEALAVTIDEIALPEELRNTIRQAWETAWTNQITFEKTDNNANVERRRAEGARDVADVTRATEILRAQGEAEAKRVSAQGTADHDKLLAQAEVDILRMTSGARTEIEFEYMTRMTELAKESGVKLTPEILMEMIRTVRILSQSGRTQRGKGADSKNSRGVEPKRDEGAQESEEGDDFGA